MALKLRETANGVRGSNELNLFGEGTYVEGKIESKGSIRIDGKVKGSVITRDTLTLGANGVISGQIEAREAIVGGRIEGDIKAQEKLVLEAKSVLIGNIETKKLVIDEGAVFQGKADMGAKSTTKDLKSSPFQEKGDAKNAKTVSG